MRAFSAFFLFLFITLNGLHQDFYGMITVGKHRREPRNNDDKHQLCGLMSSFLCSALRFFLKVSTGPSGSGLVSDRWDWDIAG